MQSSKLSCHTKTASFLIKKTKAELTDSTVAHPTHSSLFGSFFFCPFWMPNIDFTILRCIGVRISCNSHFPQLLQLFLPKPPPCPVSPSQLPICQAEQQGLSWDWGILSGAEQNVLRWAFPFGCPAEPIYFAFGEVLCKGCRSNLRLLRLSFCVLLEREGIDLCKQRGNELRDAPLPPLPLSWISPLIFVSVFFYLGFLILISTSKNKWQSSCARGINAASREVSSRSFQVLSTDLTTTLFYLSARGGLV